MRAEFFLREELRRAENIKALNDVRIRINVINFLKQWIAYQKIGFRLHGHAKQHQFINNKRNMLIPLKGNGRQIQGNITAMTVGNDAQRRNNSQQFQLSKFIFEFLVENSGSLIALRLTEKSIPAECVIQVPRSIPAQIGI